MTPRIFLVLIALLVAACDGSPLEPGSSTSYAEGDQVQFNVQFGDGLLCSANARDLREGRVMVVSQRAIVVADVDNPEGGFSDEQFRSLAATFDQQIWPTLVQNFGEPHDVDRNGRVVLFFTRAVNELAPPGQSWFVGGVFATRDIFPQQDANRLRGCPGSNYAEMIYMPVPDPTGVVNGNVRDRNSELRVAPALLAHEFQHVINATRRLYGGRANPADWTEAVWLNEGLSHIAEELMAYTTSALAPRQNLGINDFIASQPLQSAFSRYLQPNFQWLAYYLSNPDTTSLYGADSRATRGAAWQFLRYAADRRGGSEASLWRSLVDSNISGVANLRQAIGAEPTDWIHDWLVAIVTDDLAPGVQARHTQPSWNFRSLYPDLSTSDGSTYGRYPLRTRTLQDGVTQTVALAGGTAAYFAFGVAAGGTAELRLSTAAASCLQGGTVHRLNVGDALMLSESEAGAFCLGSDQAADYVLVPFYTALAGNRTVSVRGTSVIPSSANQPEQGGAERVAAASHADHHRGWEVRLRHREQRELDPLVQLGPDRPTLNTTHGDLQDQIRLAVVRVR